MGSYNHLINPSVLLSETHLWKITSKQGLLQIRPWYFIVTAPTGVRVIPHLVEVEVYGSLLNS